MSMTIQEILDLPSMKGLKIIAGGSCINSRQVRSVTVLDAPDAYSWVREGDLIVSSGYIFRDSPELLIDLIEKLAEIRSAGLGIKTDRYIKEVSPRVLDLADELGLPLIHVPNHFAFADIIHPVLSEIVNRQARLLRYSETVRHSFFDLSVNGADLQAILENLENFTHKPFGFVDTLTGERYFFGDSKKLKASFESQSLRDALKAGISDTISLNGKIFGYLTFDCSADELEEKNCEIPITQAKGAILLYMQRRIAEIQAESRYRNEFVQDILIHNLRFEGEVWNRAKMFGWNLQGSHCVAVMDIDNYKHQFEKKSGESDFLPVLEGTKKRIYSICKTYMEGFFESIPYTEMSDSISFIIPVSDGLPTLKERLQPMLKEIQRSIKEDTHFSITIGIGGQKESVFECHESYDEARKALETVRAAAGGNRVVFWKDLGAYKLLGSLYDTEAGHSFYREYIGPLIDHDKRRKSELLRTLKAMVRNNWQMKAAAQDLSVHYSTLKYRYAKICDILEFDPEDSEQRLNLALSLKLYLMNQDLEEY
ncbi:purine catabolism regulatory protein [Dethiosulfovibrio salsuginis]|uniref:Purine catabolism regulatory protein n=2 Tax=Dethiosulfovibrio salsuginis TaxID=561720 RepID=A0A1X7J816_9BACT|nr:purine catabolism regulatory protein [Dethiosulfovibrio salsuginis]